MVQQLSFKPAFTGIGKFSTRNLSDEPISPNQLSPHHPSPAIRSTATQGAIALLNRILAVGGTWVSLTAGLALFPATAQAFGFTQIYGFGDSLSDVGNVFAATGGQIPPSPYVNGRFSNGPIWLEYLAPRLGLSLNLSNDFAYGGATTEATNTILPQLPGLQQQIAGYAQAQAGTPVDPNALYVVWAGANDYLGAQQTNPLQPVAKLTGAVQTLLTLGARNIVVGNLPDLGLLPGSLAAGSTVSGGLTALSTAHNTLLAQSLALLGQANPQAKLLGLNVNALFQDAIGNPSRYGFTNVSDSCLQTTPIPSICATPNSYLFWDVLHPTTVGHQYIADSAIALLEANYPTDGGNSAGVPEPTTVVGMALVGVGVVRLRRRQRV